MKQGYVEFDGDKVIIRKGKASVSVQLLLLLLTLVLFLLPFIFTYFAYLNSSGFSFRILGSYVLLWVIAFYVFRHFLWTSFGKEHILLLPDNIVYHSDFKLFKGRVKEVRMDDEKEVAIRVNMLKEKSKPLTPNVIEEGAVEAIVLADFNEDVKAIETNIDLPEAELAKLKDKIAETYKDILVN